LIKEEIDAMLATENTVTGWSAVISELSAKQQAANQHNERLRTEKRELALEAAMGSSDAKKRLDKLNAELTKLAFECDDFQVAIAQAQDAKLKATQAEKDAVELQRISDLSKLATVAIELAEEFTAGLAQAAKAGAAVKVVTREMLQHATLGERPNLERILQTGIYMRAAEHAGLRAHLDLAPYAGPKDHLVPLEDAISTFLGRWLPNGGGPSV
jgi:seryl-tRNA synthetase